MSSDNQYIFTQDKIGPSQLLLEVLLFVLPQFIAIAVVSRFATSNISAPQNAHSYTPEILFVIGFVILSFLLIKLSKSNYSSLVYKLLFFFAIIQGLRIVLSLNFSGGVLFLALIFVMLLYFANYTIAYHNLLLLIALPGIGALLSSYLSLQSILFIIAGLVVYDFFAVYKTKHMVSMFKKMIHEEVYFAYIIPPQLTQWSHSLSFISDQRVRYMFLGTGDVIVPMLVLTHTFFISKSMTLWILIGAVLAIVGMYMILIKSKGQKALPALPFIASGMLLGYLIFMFIS